MQVQFYGASGGGNGGVSLITPAVDSVQGKRRDDIFCGFIQQGSSSLRTYVGTHRPPSVCFVVTLN